MPEIDALDNAQPIGWGDAQLKRSGASTVRTADGAGDVATHEVLQLDVRSGSNVYWRISGTSRVLQGDNAGSIQWFSGTPIGSGNQDLQLGRADVALAGLTNPNGGGAGIQFLEMTAPSAGAANTARLFCRDNGGKSQLCVIFATGAIQVIATEP